MNKNNNKEVYFLVENDALSSYGDGRGSDKERNNRNIGKYTK